MLVKAGRPGRTPRDCRQLFDCVHEKASFPAGPVARETRLDRDEPRGHREGEEIGLVWSGANLVPPACGMFPRSHVHMIAREMSHKLRVL